MPQNRSSARLSVLSLVFLTGLANMTTAQPAPYLAGAQVEGHVDSRWLPCVTVGARLATGGYALHCDGLPDITNVFAASDVRRPSGTDAVRPLVATGRPVQGRVNGIWEACTQLGNQLPTGGYRLHCPSQPDPENVFAESDVREIGLTQLKPPAQGVPTATGRPVQGRVNGNWEACTQLGNQLPTGGYRLHCPSQPDPENVFAESDVREIGLTQLKPAAQVVKMPVGRRVKGNVRGNWEACTQIGDQLPTGGYLLRCDSNPNVETVFSTSDVRL